jgi:signal transduction histidine kinase
VLIDDDGPGIPGARREKVFSRGERLDEQIHGHGLGLGIARDIVEAWGATLQLLSSTLGGLQVRIEAPPK